MGYSIIALVSVISVLLSPGYLCSAANSIKFL